MKIGVVGAGRIGQALARLAVPCGHSVMLANSRGPESLRELAAELRCQTGRVEEATAFGDVVVIAIPFQAALDLNAANFQGKTVVDTTNYYPERDGRFMALDHGEATTSGMIQERLGPEVRLVKCFNAILARDIVSDARPPGAADRRALPLAGDSSQARAKVARLVEEFGFDALNAGALEESWRFERAMPGYCIPLYRSSMEKALPRRVVAWNCHPDPGGCGARSHDAFPTQVLAIAWHVVRFGCPLIRKETP